MQTTCSCNISQVMKSSRFPLISVKKFVRDSGLHKLNDKMQTGTLKHFSNIESNLELEQIDQHIDQWIPYVSSREDSIKIVKAVAGLARSAMEEPPHRIIKDQMFYQVWTLWKFNRIYCYEYRFKLVENYIGCRIYGHTDWCKIRSKGSTSFNDEADRYLS